MKGAMSNPIDAHLIGPIDALLMDAGCDLTDGVTVHFEWQLPLRADHRAETRAVHHRPDCLYPAQ